MSSATLKWKLAASKTGQHSNYSSHLWLHLSVVLKMTNNHVQSSCWQHRMWTLFCSPHRLTETQEWPMSLQGLALPTVLTLILHRRAEKIPNLFWNSFYTNTKHLRAILLSRTPVGREEVKWLRITTRKDFSQIRCFCKTHELTQLSYSAHFSGGENECTFVDENCLEFWFTSSSLSPTQSSVHRGQKGALELKSKGRFLGLSYVIWTHDRFQRNFYLTLRKMRK